MRSLRRFRRLRRLNRWWVWLIACTVLYLGTVATLRLLLHDHLIVSTVHEVRRSPRVVIEFSLWTAFASGSDRLIVGLGRGLLGPELAIEGWLRTLARRE